MKNNILSVLIFISGMICGGFLVLQYTPKDTPAPSVCTANPMAAADIHLAPLAEGTLPQDISEVDAPPSRPQRASDLPSQLVRTELPDGIVLGIKPEETAPAKAQGVVLTDEQQAVILQAQTPAERAAEAASSVTLIEAPVAVKRISSLDAYKAFKRTALGSYPTADFAKEEVFVLESQSNLPDKAFEIVEIIPTQTDVQVLYRVNLLGLDKKTNTYNAQKVTKTKLPVVLKQVL